MQWGILRSVQWDARLIRVAVYLLGDRARSTFVSMTADVSLPNMICHSLYIPFCLITLMISRPTLYSIL